MLVCVLVAVVLVVGVEEEGVVVAVEVVGEDVAVVVSVEVAVLDVAVEVRVEVAVIVAVLVADVVGVVQLAHFSCRAGHTIRIGRSEGTHVPVFTCLHGPDVPRAQFKH